MIFYNVIRDLRVCAITVTRLSERDSLTVRALACHAADPGSNPAQGDDVF